MKPGTRLLWIGSVIAAGVGVSVLELGAQRRGAAISGEMVATPSFSVQVHLGAGSARALKAAGETLVVAAYLDGDGEPWLSPEERGPFRDVPLGSARVELDGAGLATFENIRVPVDAIRRLDDPDFHVTINVFSGRRVFKDNILRGGTYLGRIGAMSAAVTDVRVD